MNLPNWISLFRILCVPFFIAAIAYYSPGKDYLRLVALAIFSVAVLSDAVDGYIARTRQLKTRLGSFLDPLADKLLLTSSFVTLAVAPNLPAPLRLPIWVPIVFIFRDVILVLGTALIHIVTGSLTIRPSLWGKVTTFFQMVTIITLLLHSPAAPFIWRAAAFFSIISGVDYIGKGGSLLSVNGSVPQGSRTP